MKVSLLTNFLIRFHHIHKVWEYFHRFRCFLKWHPKIIEYFIPIFCLFKQKNTQIEVQCIIIFINDWMPASISMESYLFTNYIILSIYFRPNPIYYFIKRLVFIEFIDIKRKLTVITFK